MDLRAEAFRPFFPSMFASIFADLPLGRSRRLDCSKSWTRADWLLFPSPLVSVHGTIFEIDFFFFVPPAPFPFLKERRFRIMLTE